MKTITIHELLGMVKDGKAPKRIIYDEYVYKLNEDIKNYEREIDPFTTINWDYIVMNCLNEEVEIIEEEKKIPEKLDLDWQNAFDEQVQQDCIKMISENINTILDYLKSKGE